MKLLNKKEISKWAYYQYMSGNCSKEIEELITDPFWNYWFNINKVVPDIITKSQKIKKDEINRPTKNE